MKNRYFFGRRWYLYKIQVGYWGFGMTHNKTETKFQFGHWLLTNRLSKKENK